MQRQQQRVAAETGRAPKRAAALAVWSGIARALPRRHGRRGLRPTVADDECLVQRCPRSTYLLASSVALLLLFWQWRPIGGVVWSLESTAAQAVAYGVFAIGWVTILVCTFLIDHFDLFGLRQVWLALLDRPYTPVRFTTPGPYRVVRHPL